MEIFALVGKSGTGKSTSVLQYCHREEIPAFIDDGLFIVNGKKVAGISAKHEKNYIRAVKRATFYYPDHKEEVKKAISHVKPKKMLIVGTSIKMVNLIAERLEIGKIDRYIDVTEIRSKKEIKMALFVRKTEEKHVIPIPSMQIEPTMVKRIMLRRKNIFYNQKKIGETTIVRPNFSKGTISISETVLKDIILYKIKQMKEVKNVRTISYSRTQVPKLKLNIDLACKKQQNLIDICQMLQMNLFKTISTILELELESIDIQITNLTYTN